MIIFYLKKKNLSFCLQPGIKGGGGEMRQAK